MTVYLSRTEEGYLLLRARAAGEGIVGDMVRELRPGESACGRSYDEWSALPDGPYEVC